MRTMADLMRYALDLDAADPKREDPIPVTQREYENLRDALLRMSRSPADVIRRVASLSFMGRRLEIL